MTRKRILTPVDPENMGKLPPQAVDLEEAVLGAILLEESAYFEVADILSPNLFYKEEHSRICQAIINIKDRGDKADILTVCQELKKSGELELVGGAYKISSLTNRIASSAHIEIHLRVIQEMWVKREAIMSSTKIIKDCYDETADFSDIIDEYEQNLISITDRLFTDKADDLSVLNKSLLEDNAVLRSKRGTVIGISTGFEEMDIVLGGWQNSDLIILAARPGMGKTALALNYAINAAVNDRSVAMFSLEMSSLQLYKRMASQTTQIPLEMILREGMDDATLNTYNRDIQELLSKKIYIDDSSSNTIFDIRSKARKLKREKKISMIIVDYIQLIPSGKSSSGNREQEVSHISRSLKLLAKELNVPIIALSQLSRNSENRPGGSKKPQLSDLRESGSIEQDADQVQFIFRPEYYNISVDEDNQPTKGMAKIIIAKNRHGAITDVALRFKADCVLFQDLPNDNLSPMQVNDEFLKPII